MQEIADILGLPADISSQKPGSAQILTTDEFPANSESEKSAYADATFVLDCAQQLQTKSATFENEIRRLGLEMHSLQKRSSSIHCRLARREETLRLLNPLLEKYSVPVSVINAIEGDIGPQWVDAVTWLQNANSGSTETATAAVDASKMRQALLSLAISRAKSFFVLKLRALRRPCADAQVIQQQLIQASPALKLLQDHTPKLASSLNQAYQNTMKWYYTMLFGKYGRWLGRQPLARVDSPRLLGASVGTQKAKYTDAFSIGARPAVLLSSAQPLPMTALPPSSNPYYSIEVLMNSMVGALADSFKTEQQLGSNLTYLFEPVLAQYADLAKSWISQCSGDIFGLLLVVQLLNSHQQILPIEWLNGITQQCWPSILKVLEDQSHSIEQAALKASVAGSGRQSGPHIITQLLSSYLSGILQLSPGEIDSQLAKCLRQIVGAYELFVSKLAAGDELVLYNNYFVMTALLSDIDGKLALEFANHFQLLVDAFSNK